jgi:HEPN domain-containing protein
MKEEHSMKRNLQNEAERRLLQAKKDLDDARYSAEGERYNLTCFLCQQSAEKALKAYLYFVGAEEVWGHSVAELVHDASDFNGRFVELVKIAASLDKYYLPMRYPNGLPGGIPSGCN